MNVLVRRSLAAGVVCVLIGAAFALLGAAAAAASVPSISGIWLAYVQPSLGSPNRTFVIRAVAGSSRVSGTCGPFKLSGTVSSASGEAKLCAGCCEARVSQTTDWRVTFVFRSRSTAQTNHSTSAGSYDNVVVASGQVRPARPVRAVRCSDETGAKALAGC